MLFSRECTIFGISNKTYTSPHSVKIGYFEEFLLNEYSQSIQLCEYTWVDTIKYRDKIVSRSKKRVNILYFKKEMIVVFFSNSESDVAFVSSQLNKLFSLELIRIDIFNDIKHELIMKQNIENNPQLISIHMRMPLDNDVDKDISLDVSKIEEKQFEKILMSNNLVSLKFISSEGLHFDVDRTSVFSFNDNDTLEEIINVLQGYAAFI